MATYNLITDFIKLNEFRFYPENATLNPLYNTFTFDGGSLEQSLLPWQLQNPFYHKKLFIDTCTVYSQTQANFVGSAVPYPDLQLLDHNKNFLLDLSIYPFIKGSQQVSGNTIYNPLINADVQANTYCWQFSFQSLLPPNMSGIYYLRHINYASDGITSVSHISEPIFVFGQSASAFPDTVLLSCYNNSNNNYMGYLRGGWSDPNFYPIFRHRIEAYLTEFDPKSIYIGFLQQKYEQEQILAENYRAWKLEAGGMGSNFTDFMHEKVNEAMSCDVFTIDGKRYKRDINDTDAGVKSLWQGTRPQTVNKRWVSAPIREESNDQHIFFDIKETPCSCPTLDAVRITLAGLTYTFHFDFDMSAGFICPFRIGVRTSFTGGSFYYFNINSLADFTSSSGDIYTLSSIIGGFPDIEYRILTTVGELCYEGTATYEECSAPMFSGYTLEPALTPGEFNIAFNFTDCGTECTGMTFDYMQLLPASGTPDSGSVSFLCENPPLNYEIPVTPSDYVEGDTVKYSVTYTDCCGASGVIEVTYNPPCVAPTLIWDMEIIRQIQEPGSPFPRLRLAYESCDGTCNTLQLFISRTAPTTSGESASTVTIPCTSVPYEALVTVPDGGVTSGTLAFNVRAVDCCGNETNTPLSIDLDCTDAPPDTTGGFSIVQVGMDYFFRVTFLDCGDCNELTNIIVKQSNSLVSGVADYILVNSKTVPCDEGFPYIWDIPITPNLDVTGDFLAYSINWVTCCSLRGGGAATFSIP